MLSSAGKRHLLEGGYMWKEFKSTVWKWAVPEIIGTPSPEEDMPLF